VSDQVRADPVKAFNAHFPDLAASIEIESNFTPANAEPSMNCTLRGISIDSSEEDENAALASDRPHIDISNNRAILARTNT
jgi:hypothetical protein